jgi:NADPH:quinone reductase-like Zn-dependent oxidoreductase
MIASSATTESRKKMSSVTGNEAAWIPAEKARCEVGPGPLPKPAENEVVIEVAYAAVNPIDYLVILLFGLSGFVIN